MESVDRVHGDPASVGEAGIQAWRQQLIGGIFRALVVIGPVAAIAGTYYDYARGVYSAIPLYWLAYGLLLVLTFWRRVPYTVKVVALVLLFYALAIGDFLSDGRGGSGRIFLLILPFAASTFFGLRRGAVAVGVVLVTMIGMAFAYTTGLVTVAQEVDSTDPAGWASNTVVLLLVGTFIMVAQNYLVPRLAGALEGARGLAADLARERERLEVEVAERTVDLTRRNLALQAAAQVARDTASAVTLTRDVDQLLAETVMLISKAFGYYHSGIFLIDEGRHSAVLQAVSSQEGEAMLAEGHRLALGEGVVGNAATAGEPHIALDVGADRVFFDNPHLPETRSEAALPLRIGGEVIGVLDVQSREAAAFDEESISVLQTLADQVAVAIGNARLLRNLQESVEAERRAYGELSLRAWQEFVRASGQLEERYDPAGILPRDGAWLREMDKVVREGCAVDSQYKDLPGLCVPIKVRDQVIGAIDAFKPPGGGDWSEQERALLETLVDQLGVALDSARLYEDAQQRAARDRLVGEVTGRMRETLDMETVLRTTADEMLRVLELDEITVRLVPEDGSGDEMRSSVDHGQ